MRSLYLTRYSAEPRSGRAFRHNSLELRLKRLPHFGDSRNVLLNIAFALRLFAEISRRQFGCDDKIVVIRNS